MQKEDRPSGSDAVCFTAGPQGVAFSAGVIHAWLASDRDTPQAMAGISAGALSAAAMARACHQRDQARNPSPPATRRSVAELESRRWAWFRQYLDAITNEPLKPIWDAIPDPDDFFADKPPVADLSVQSLPPKLRRAEARAREHYHRLVKLGLWLAGLHVSVSEVATCLVRWVRFKEGYALGAIQGLLLFGRGLLIATKAILHLALSPRFSARRVAGGRISLPLPLFGWAWGIALLLVGDAVYWLLKIFVRVWTYAAGNVTLHPLVEVLRTELDQRVHFTDLILPWLNTYVLHDYWPWVSSIASWAGGVALAVVVLTVIFPSWIFSYLVHRLGVHRSLFDSYCLSRKLFELFSDAGEGVKVSSGLLLVAAPLQRYENEFGKQVWFEPGQKTVAEALTAALAIPGLFQAVPVTSGIAGQKGHLDLIDGALVRQNPLPALFRWLRLPQQNELAQKLFGKDIDDASIHLVYSVPIQPDAVQSASRKERIDLVESAKIGLDLARRRDSRMELRQTNFISELALQTMWGTGKVGAVYPIFADEIAPSQEIKFDNNLAPRREELLKVVAAGCRSTLETLHRNTLTAWGAPPVACDKLLSQIAAGRSHFVQPQAPGLGEVCQRCTRELRAVPDPVAESSKHQGPWYGRLAAREYEHLAPHNGGASLPPVTAEVQSAASQPTEASRAASAGQAGDPHSGPSAHHTQGQQSSDAEVWSPPGPPGPARYPHAPAHGRPSEAREIAQPHGPVPSHQPRIVFLAAGGVFRGAFHIGVIGAMQVARMKPDLIVGASVGTLMGGALGAISTLREPESRQRLLGELCLTFLEVDRRVALTKGLKNAVKQLGTRGRAVHLSPASLRRAVRQGTRSDPGFAATGAPSILIDAISTLFLIPHRDTSEIAATFVAGQITKALKQFWDTARYETLRRLEIDTALIGTSLLEERAKMLLGAGPFDAHHQIDLTRDQPYPDISIFATASDLSRSRPLLLPRDLPDTQVYNFVEAGLSSSAFPAAFRPRQQAELQPGLGATDILYADGGMFDNLPFFPAIEVLSVVQKNWRKKQLLDAPSYLQQRLDAPDLFLAASLDGELSKADQDHPPESFWEVHQRAGKLSVNGKLNSFLENANLIAKHSQLLHDAYPNGVPAVVEDFMDGIVNAAVLKITPTDKKHLNGTFAFAKSVGFSKETVALSIADGCFQTLRSIIQPQGELASASVEKLKATDRIAELSTASKREPGVDDACPFFRYTQGMKPFRCPFSEAAARSGPEESKTLRLIYEKCIHDRDHKRSIHDPPAKKHSKTESTLNVA